MFSDHGRRQRGARGRAPPWIFIHDTDKVEGGFIMLFFGLVSLLLSPDGNFSADAFVSDQCKIKFFPSHIEKCYEFLLIALFN